MPLHLQSTPCLMQNKTLDIFAANVRDNHCVYVASLQPCYCAPPMLAMRSGLRGWGAADRAGQRCWVSCKQPCRRRS